MAQFWEHFGVPFWGQILGMFGHIGHNWAHFGHILHIVVHVGHILAHFGHIFGYILHILVHVETNFWIFWEPILGNFGAHFGHIFGFQVLFLEILEIRKLWGPTLGILPFLNFMSNFGNFQKKYSIEWTFNIELGLMWTHIWRNIKGVRFHHGSA